MPLARCFDLLLGLVLFGSLVPQCFGHDSPPPAPPVVGTPLAKAIGGGEPLFERLPRDRTGIDFENRFAWNHERKHLYTHGFAGGGVCLGDVDGDGRPDLYLVSQVGKDKLYRQIGDFRFEDVTERSGIEHGTLWGAGAAFADIDNDADLDLYICNYDAPNLLYLNQGDGTFEEAAGRFGLDFRGASIMSSFADYDLDGDLDLYLLTNRLYPGPVDDYPRTTRLHGKVIVEPGFEEAFRIQERNINGEAQKFVVKAGQRDRLYRNNGDDTFTDVSRSAGIEGNHPGLSATWWDFDGDRDPDIYVCNDFWDPDRFYRNNGDGTFTDILKHAVGHTPWFSMGADSADIDNDGRVDFLAADMSATTHYMSKLMMGDMNESRWFLESAEPRQYMRNAVYLNTGTERFMEVAYLTNLASSDWTWSVKFGDLDNDGWVDVFFTNGTANHSFDPDLTRELRNLAARQNRAGIRDPAVRHAEQWELIRKQPLWLEKNLAFQNRGELAFENSTDRWGLGHLGISFGAAYADLDRDGDLDLVVNNVDDPVGIYRNRGIGGNRILVRLEGRSSNRFGIGATVTVVTASTTQVRQLFPSRGYMSANEPIVHFGLGTRTAADSLTIDWPSGSVQNLANLRAGHLYTIVESAPDASARERRRQTIPAFEEVGRRRGLENVIPRERPFDDYQTQPLLPAKLSRLGPGLSWGDADGDGDDDLYVGGPAGEAGRLVLNRDGGHFELASRDPWVADARAEDMAAVWFDADRDGDLDLYVASGGVELKPGDPALRDRLYANDGFGVFSLAPAEHLPDARTSSSAVVAGDLDSDGDLDLFVGSRVIPGHYPRTPKSQLLRNDEGRFVEIADDVAPGLAAQGLVTAALWSDASDDGELDLLVTTEWGPVAYWQNRGGRLEDQTEAADLEGRRGWWNSIIGFDIDGDDDPDYVVLNAGLNTKYKAHADAPALLYFGELEGRFQLIEAKSDEGNQLPIRGLSCSAQAMPFIRQKVPTYRDFARATLEEIYSPESIAEARFLRATHLESGILVNDTDAGGSVLFSYVALPRLAQASPGFGVSIADFDADGFMDVYFVQNFFWREPETGRWDGGVSLWLRGDEHGRLTEVSPAASGLVVSGDARAQAIADIDGDGRPEIAVAQNDDRVLLFQRTPATLANTPLAVRLRGAPGNPTCVGARVTVVYDGVDRMGTRAPGHRQTAEVYAGSGYLSQSSATLFFGAGSAEYRPREVRVRWPDGEATKHSLENAMGGRITLAQPETR